MEIEVRIHASSVEDFRRQVLELAGVFGVKAERSGFFSPGSAPEPLGRTHEEAVDTVEAKKPDTVPMTSAKPLIDKDFEVPKRRGRPPKVLAGNLGSTPKPNGQGSEAPEPAVEIPEPPAETVGELGELGASPKEMLELKDKVIEALREAFREGKVAKVRAVLDTYGEGAKSFREIDASLFPDIQKAIQGGALN